jgi:glucose-6-phosphate 1-dehydrogenase
MGYGLVGCRWAGVPWIMKAGKALNERKVEIRVQYKPPAAGIYGHLNEMRNELVVRTHHPVIKGCSLLW